METPVSDDRISLGIHQSVTKDATAPADDLVVARRRMRHLAFLDIKPLPMMHSVAGALDESLPPEHRERPTERGLYLLAVHIWQAAPKTALR